MRIADSILTSMKTLCSLIILLTLSAEAFGDDQKRHIDQKFISSFSNKFSPYNGPNCVNAALLALGFHLPVMDIEPDFAQSLILPTCFNETNKNLADVGAYYNQADALIHMFAIVDHNKVFTKNGFPRWARYRIMSESLMAQEYPETAKVRYFQLSENPDCILNKLVQSLEDDPIFSADIDVIKRSITQRRMSSDYVWIDAQKYFSVRHTQDGASSEENALANFKSLFVSEFSDFIVHGDFNLTQEELGYMSTNDK